MGRGTGDRSSVVAVRTSVLGHWLSEPISLQTLARENLRTEPT